jgi:hypothetical protein
MRFRVAGFARIRSAGNSLKFGDSSYDSYLNFFAVLGCVNR